MYTERRKVASKDKKKRCLVQAFSYVLLDSAFKTESASFPQEILNQK
jgi:hypothetical protein